MKTMAGRNNSFFVVLLIFTIGATLHSNSSHAQRDSVDRKRLSAVVITTAVGVPVTYAGLYQLWYKDSPRQRFTFFNDNAEWKQLDKAGHFFSSFYLSYAGSQVLRWSKVEPSKADLAAAVAGFLIVAPVEIFDGYSAAYGASSGDLIADAAGPLFFLGQKRLWNEIRIHPKLSFHRTRYAKLRPELLGDTFISEMVKDYNGHTHWLSFDLDKFTRFPKWLNVAVGYGAEEMVYARDAENTLNGFNNYRQYYLAVDFDLTAVRSRSKLVKTLLFVANAIKLPAPTFVFSKNKGEFRALYF